MIKIFSVCFLIMMLVFPVADAVVLSDVKDAEISRLTAEKQYKYAELEKCVKSVKGLQIAGVSTIGLTAGGVALNVSQANKSKSLDNQINSTNSKIEKKKQQIEEMRIKAEKEKAEKEAQEKARAECEKDDTKKFEDGKCVDKTPSQEQQKESQIIKDGDSDAKVESDDLINTNQETESKENSLKCDESKGEVVSVSGDGCIRCEPSLVAKDGRCVECPETQKAEDYKCVDFTCGPSEFKSRGKCFQCPENNIVENNNCVECPKTQKAENNKCVDFTCGPSEFKSGGKCVDCSVGGRNMVPKADLSGCERSYVDDALSGMKQACAQIGGFLAGEKRCYINISYKGGEVENFEKVQALCHVVSEYSGLVAHIGQEDGAYYCGI